MQAAGFYRQGDIPIDGALLYHPIDGAVRLAQDIYFLDRHGIKYWAFEGMPTDGASIPKLHGASSAPRSACLGGGASIPAT